MQQSPAAFTCSLVFFVSYENKLRHYKQSRDLRCITPADILLKVEESADTFLKNRKGNGKPIFPQCVDEISSLGDLTREDSWYFFMLLKIETDFLKKPVEEQSEDSQFIAGKTNAKIITVVNDCSERGIKLATDFHSSANAQNNFENTLQLVEKSRSSRPNLQKRSLT